MPIEFDRLAQESAGLLEYRAALRLADHQQGAGTKEAVVGIEIVGAAPDEAGFLRGTHGYLERLDNPPRDVVLDLEHVGHVPVETLGPEMSAGGCIDQLRGDPDAGAGAADRALEHRTDAELAADGADIDRTTLVGEA